MDMEGKPMKGDWFFGIDDDGEEFSIQTAHVKYVSLTTEQGTEGAPEKGEKRTEGEALLEFHDETGVAFYEVKGQKARETWDRWKAYHGGAASGEPA